MSTVAELQDRSSFNTAIAEVRSDSSPINWAAACHVNGIPNIIGLLSKGSGGPHEMVKILKDDEVMYSLVRLEEQIDMSSNIKFLYIHWVGDNVPFSKRGRYGVLHGSVEAMFGSSHGIIETGSIADLTEEEMMSQLAQTSGTKSKVMEVSEATARQDRGFTSSSNIIKTGKTQSVVQNPGAVTVHMDASVSEALVDVRDDQTSTCWCAASYEDNNPKKPIVLVGRGEEGLSGLLPVLQSDNVVYALLRVTDHVDDIPTVKFVYIQWVGEQTKPMTKGKISTHKATVEKCFHPAHVNLFATDLAELSESIVMNKVKSASGSKSHVK